MCPSRMLLTAALLATAITALGERLACATNDIPLPDYFGTQVTSLTAKEIHGYKNPNSSSFTGIPFDYAPIDFCNVTITYTHPGLNDTVNVYVWLPLEDWNGNFLAQGGGGWAAGMEGALAPAVASGYAGANTDAGHTIFGDPMAAALSADAWALTSPGNVNWVLLQDFASVALDDMTNLAKDVVGKFYGQAPKYSYWNGCSTGGRQGLMQAQRYPKNYDGILAAAPAINFDSFLVAELWGQMKMRWEQYSPPRCELEAIRKAAMDACDDIDGVKDGVVAAPGLCEFNAQSVIGQEFDCDGNTRKITERAATIANAAWEGPVRDGRSEWPGLTHETPLAGDPALGGGLLGTSCDEKNKKCIGVPFPISHGWVRLFLARDAEYDWEAMTEDGYFRFLHMSRQQYKSIMGTDDPNLSEFRAAGGKMITWHGLADSLIFPNGSSNYYARVLAIDPEAKDYYRYFEAPGVGHCFGGVGAFPGQAFQSLVDWVEKGEVPERLEAATIPADKAEAVKYRPLCLYPKVAAYMGGDPDDASSYECATSFGTKRAIFPGHTELK